MHLQPYRDPNSISHQTSADHVKASAPINKPLPKNHPPRSTLAANTLSLSHKPHSVIVNGTVKLLAAMLLRSLLDRSQHDASYKTCYDFEFETASKKPNGCAFCGNRCVRKVRLNAQLGLGGGSKAKPICCTHQCTLGRERVRRHHSTWSLLEGQTESLPCFGIGGRSCMPQMLLCLLCSAQFTHSIHSIHSTHSTPFNSI
jgi:hypothetical protein